MSFRPSKLMAMQGDMGGQGGGYPPQGGMPPGGMPPGGAPPAAPAKKGSGGMIAAVLGGVIVLGGGGAAAYMFLGGAPSLPLKLGQLPSDTKTIARTMEGPLAAAKLGVKPGDLPEEARWSDASKEFCGGVDIFDALLSASNSEYGAEKLAEAFADKDELKKTLECGKTVASELGGKFASYRIVFKAGKESHGVSAVMLDMKELPETTKRMKAGKDPDNLESTRCLKPPTPEGEKEDKDKEKKEDDADKDKCVAAYAKIQNEKVWLSGDMEDLKKFGAEFSKDAKNKVEDGELLEKVLKGLSGDAVRAGLGADGGAQGAVPYVKDEEIRTKMEKLLKGVKVWGRSSSFDGPWEKERIELHCDGESDAKDLEEGLAKYLKEAYRQSKESLEKREEEKEKEEKEKEKNKDKDKDKKSEPGEKEREKFQLAKQKTEVRAMKEPKVSRSGSVVVVEMVEEPEDSDKEAWEAFAKFNGERVKLVAAIVKKLADGEKPSDAELKELGEKVLEAINPPEWVTLDELASLRVPGGGGCRSFGGKSDEKSCKYKKLDKEALLKKLEEAATKDGFTWGKREFSDSFFDVSKGDKKLELFVMGDGKDPATLMVKFKDKE